MTETKDFTQPVAEPLRFKIDEDEFEVASVPPFGATSELAKLASGKVVGLNGEVEATIEDVDHLIAFLDAVFLPASAERFAERIRDAANPITDEQVANIAQWLIEQYMARPTQPPSPSSNGHGGTGTSSTGSVPQAASIPVPYQLTGSST